MNFEALKRRVERSEQVVDGRMRQTDASWRSLRARWREAWTPPRIVIAGAIAGFVAGRTDAEGALRRVGKLASPRTMQLITSLTGLIASAQSAYAAATAKDASATAGQAADTADQAADTADDAARTAAGTAGAAAAGASPESPSAPAPESASAPPASSPPPPRSDRRRPDPSWEQQPSPAEAATDLSER